MISTKCMILLTMIFMILIQNKIWTFMIFTKMYGPSDYDFLNLNST